MTRTTTITFCLGLAVAVALGPSSAAHAATNVVPNPGFEQGGCASTPVICGWAQSPDEFTGMYLASGGHSGGASMAFSHSCGVNGCLGSVQFSYSAETDPAFCAPIGPGPHSASFWALDPGYWDTGETSVSLDAIFYQGADCTGQLGSDGFGDVLTPFGDWQQLLGVLTAPAGTQSALFRVSGATDTYCSDYCGVGGASFDDVEVDDTLVPDTTPPQTTITSSAPDPASTSATFTFTASERSTFECSLDDAAFASCTSPATYSALAEGPHSFRVRATDAAGNTDPTPAEQDWTVDTFFSLAATPDSLSMAPEGFDQSTIQTAGTDQPISLSASGQPATAAVWFSPSVVAAGGSSTMMVSVGTATEPGTYTIVVTGAGTSVSHTTTVTLVVSATDFSISANPLLIYVQQGSSATGTIGTFSLTAQAVALSASGQPAGASVRFSPASVTAGGSSTMNVDVNAGTLPGNYPLTITGTGPSTTHALTITLAIEPSTADFSISASPASLNRAQGATGTSTVQTTTTSGSAQMVGLSASGQPTGTAVSFNPTSVTSGGSSTMTLNVGAATAPGTYTITVTGAGASVAHTTTVALTVSANQPPRAALTLSCAGLTCSFDASSSSDPDGTVQAYSWNFGDGTNTAGETTTHTYAQTNAYTVDLSVTDDSGATATATENFTLIALSAHGYKIKGLEKVDLAWNSQNGTSFNIYRNDGKITTVQTGPYTDNINSKGTGTYTYKVCTAGSVCSNTASVTF